MLKKLIWQDKEQFNRMIEMLNRPKIQEEELYLQTFSEPLTDAFASPLLSDTLADEFSTELFDEENACLFSLEDSLEVHINPLDFEITESQVAGEGNQILIFSLEKKKREMLQSGGEMGDFAQAKKIISENRQQFVQIWKTVQDRAMQIQIACCPPGQKNNSVLSSGASLSLAFVNPLAQLSENHSFCDDDHEEKVCTCQEGGKSGCPKHGSKAA